MALFSTAASWTWVDFSAYSSLAKSHLVKAQNPIPIATTNPPLLWRLRVELGASFCFTQDNRQAMRSALTDPAASGPLAKGPERPGFFTRTTITEEFLKNRFAN
jgi:hypothetical protein